MVKAAGDGINRDRPVSLNVAAGDDHVAIKVGELVVALDPETARDFAECILSALGEVTGEAIWLMTGSMRSGTVK